MITNQWIETSRRVYSAFLNLYPQEHRTEYGEPMRQVFSDQCRNAYNQKGALGMIQLWLRTLPDLGYTALLEHITSPKASWGLMEPVPNAPLPWKGVFLVLLPGLVYLISQVAQLTGQPWYLTVYYRAAFLLIIPVLAVWFATRRFPIWGLIPLGLLFRLLEEIGYQLIVLHPNAFSSNPLLNLVLIIAKQIQEELLILVALFIAITLFLAWRYVRLHKPSRSFWICTGVYVFAIILQILINLKELPTLVATGIYPDVEIWNFVKDTITGVLYDATAFICLVFIGTLFMRRHGFFAILIPVGYILPVMLIGVPWQIEDPSTSTVFLAFIYTAVLAYRSLLSLVAPIWMSRSNSLAGKKRAVVVSIAIALIIHTITQFYPLMIYPQQGVFSATWLIWVAVNELELISGILLGVSMYQNTLPAINSPGKIMGEQSPLTMEKA